MANAVPVEADLSRYPAFARVVDHVGATNGLQRKRVRAMLAGQDRDVLRVRRGAEPLARAHVHEAIPGSLPSRPARTTTSVSRCFESRSGFEKRASTASTMPRWRTTPSTRIQNGCGSTSIGLLLTYLFWPNHYALFRLFRDGIARVRPRRALEVGAGHGLFTAELLRRWPETDLTVVDISPGLDRRRSRVPHGTRGRAGDRHVHAGRLHGPVGGPWTIST